MKQGVYTIEKKDGTTLYRASLTVKEKHISLGSFDTEQAAHEAYLCGKRIMSETKDLYSYVEDFRDGVPYALPFEKVVVLVNLRQNHVYIKTPIFLEKRSFLYLYSPEFIYKFDVDDLFYYSNHKIMKRGSHLFVSDYGMQENILARYGIKRHAVKGRDYEFVNGDDRDMRYGNVRVINRYYGVTRQMNAGREEFIAKIHVNGDMIIGKYSSEKEAAIAYNKSAMILKNRGVNIDFPTNYIDGMSELEYISLQNKVRLSDTIRSYYPE